MPPVGLDSVSEMSLAPGSMPASRNCLRTPPQLPVNVSCSNNPFSWAVIGPLAGPSKAPTTITGAEKPTRTKNQGSILTGKLALDRAKSLDLSQSLSRTPSAVDSGKGTLRSQKILRDTGHGRGEIGILGTTLNDRLVLDEGLVLPVQIKP